MTYQTQSYFPSPIQAPGPAMLISFLFLNKIKHVTAPGLCTLLCSLPGTPLLPHLTHLHSVGFRFSSLDFSFTHHLRFLSPISQFISFRTLISETTLSVSLFPCFLTVPLTSKAQPLFENKHFTSLIQRCPPSLPGRVTVYYRH